MIVSRIILGIVSSILIFWSIYKFIYWIKQKKEFQLFQQQIQPGTILVREYKPENPFLETHQTKYKVLNVKDGWCEYVLFCLLKFKNYKEHIRYDTIKYLYEQEFKIDMELQNDYTTKEQSDQLLRLGLPRISANLYYDDEDELQFVKDKEHELIERGYFPCWSVGRLMEIYKIVGEEAGQCISCSKNQTQVESLVQLYEENIRLLDFSKLYDDKVTE